MKKKAKEVIMDDVEDYLEALPDAEVKFPAEQLKSLLHEIKICNWRQVTNIANEIRDQVGE
jgi:hypothetical protein